MITVLPKTSFIFINSNRDWNDLEKIVSTIQAIQAANPFVDTIEFLNQTKACTVNIAFSGNKIQVIFRNPKDEEFDLNDLEIKPTPFTLTGR